MQAVDPDARKQGHTSAGVGSAVSGAHTFRTQVVQQAAVLGARENHWQPPGPAPGSTVSVLDRGAVPGKAFGAIAAR
ncbi:hypothetical protein [Mycobacteroides chelonae]|uniref:hypothetical protein n=1 Tax=Mycobacteroides chelonae TaxID=1774 RepID=UPI001E32C3F5|nr:hypothetical protein [Mycobacteroides chelonae]